MRNLPDVQKETKGFPHLYIESVGTENIRLQLPICTPDGTEYVLASMRSYCSLDESVKGINMSRIGRTIRRVIEETPDGFRTLAPLADALLAAHDEATADVSVAADFPYLLQQITPVTGISAPKAVEISMASVFDNGVMKNYLTIETTEMSLCPCSKELSLLKNNLNAEEKAEIEKLSPELREKIYQSGFGAHNQKSTITVTVELAESSDFTIAGFAEMISESASSPTYSILKRPDEKWVTEVSYLGGYYDEAGVFHEVGGGPKFVEDIVRSIALKLSECLDDTIRDYIVYVKNYESIHSDGIVATAIMSAGRSLKRGILTLG